MIDFPASPTNGQQYTYDGRTWEFDAAAGGGVGAWNLVPVSTSDADLAAESATDAHADKLAAEAAKVAAADSAEAAAANQTVTLAASVTAVSAAESAADSAGFAATSARVEATWVALAAITGSADGVGAVVRGDGGVHTDPVSGALVANSGQYRWKAASTAWQWISIDPMQSKVDRSEFKVAEDKLSSLYQFEPALSIPLAGLTDANGNVQTVVDYSVDARRMRVNGQELPDQSLLGDRMSGQYTIEATNSVPLVAVTSASGALQAAVDYHLPSGQLRVHGVAVGGIPLRYATLQSVSGVQKPVFTAVMHLMTYGQSLSKGFASTPPYSTLQPYSNITFAQGPKSTKAGSVGLLPGMNAFAPLIENTLNGDGVDAPQTGETPCSAWANGLTRRLAIEGEDWRTSGRQFLGSANGKGSASITQLLPGGTTDLGEWFQVVRDAITQGNALAVGVGKVYSLPVWLYMQGEGDNSNEGYAGGAWRDSLQTMHSAVTAHYQTVTGSAYMPWLGVYQTYARTRRERPHATIDQLDYCETAANVFHLTAIYHLPLASDGHLSALGSYWVGQYAAKKTRQLLAGYRPQWMRLGVATVSGRVVRYRPKEIPVAPLRLWVDEHVRSCVDFGFLVRDANGGCSIESIGISAQGDEVVITLDSAPTGAVQLRYGLDYLPSGQVDYSGSAGGNLIDSDPETFEYGGVEYPLFNVSPHFQVEVIPV